MKEKEKIKEIRTTLKARIIPNLPLEGDTRKFVKNEIDRFEFDWYFKQFEKKIETFRKSFIKTHNLEVCPLCSELRSKIDHAKCHG